MRVVSIRSSRGGQITSTQILLKDFTGVSGSFSPVPPQAESAEFPRQTPPGASARREAAALRRVSPRGRLCSPCPAAAPGVAPTGRDGTRRDGTGGDGMGQTGRDGTGGDRTRRDGTEGDGMGLEGTGREWTGRDGPGQDGTGQDRTKRAGPGPCLARSAVSAPAGAPRPPPASRPRSAGGALAHCCAPRSAVPHRASARLRRVSRVLKRAQHTHTPPPVPSSINTALRAGQSSPRPN